ncbi:unnamed protein product [Prorocentrum cordatum]|uniref:Uncharacterized protein n=1 Tax=Prorocentrum cordatum TaxID=2364126 RepID=A0ABN9WRM5_9DINO|nr:unnamed protein product [Polarella glacialis]
MVSAAGHGAFGGSGNDKVAHWVQFVASVQDAPADTHPLIFYAGTARALAEFIGSVEPTDYAEEKMRDFVISSLQVNAVPFDQDQDEQWENFKLKPAHITLALKVQTKAMREFPSGCPGSSSAADQTAQAIAEWAKVQHAKAEKEAKRGTSSFNLQDRIAEVGLRCVQGYLLPTEEALLRMENLPSAKIARGKGRKWVGSSEGEDLLANFRPGFSKTPKLDVLVGSGTIGDKERIGFMGFANFLGHLHDWGTKMVLSKVITPVQYWAYEMQLGQGDQVEVLLCRLDRDVLEDASHKVKQRAEEVNRANSKQTSGPASSQGYAPSQGGKPGSQGKGGQKGGKPDKGGKQSKPARPAPTTPQRSRSPPKGKGAASAQWHTKGQEKKWSSW